MVRLGFKGDLKVEIFEKLNIPPSKQIIDCWYARPEEDNDILGKCCESGTSFLVVYDSDKMETECGGSEDVAVTEEENNFRGTFSITFVCKLLKLIFL